MKTTYLTTKQEAFCHAYIRYGNKSQAYREVYFTSNMKPETINERACKLSNEYKVSTRIETLQEELSQRNKIDIDEVVKGLAEIFRFDIIELYDETGTLKDINKMSSSSRRMITQLDTFEVYDSKGNHQGTTKKIRVLSKLEAIEKLMKHLGGYSLENKQKNHPVQQISTLLITLPDGTVLDDFSID